MRLAMANGFNEMFQNEMMEVDGGVAFIPAVIYVARVLAGCALIGFGVGLGYETLVISTVLV